MSCAASCNDSEPLMIMCLTNSVGNCGLNIDEQSSELLIVVLLAQLHTQEHTYRRLFFLTDFSSGKTKGLSIALVCEAKKISDTTSNFLFIMSW